MPGKIKVKILAGRNLPVMDRSGDTTDAYVELKFGNITYKTDVCRKSLNPQWNSEWYRFEVDDAELQDEPLQIRLMDHDTYSANDAIGKVYINLNPLLLPGAPPTVKNIWTLEAAMNTNAGSQSGSVMTGWIPVYDTMHGIRGEVNIIVKVELFSDFNKFRQSSCGVQFFYSPNIPHGYHTQNIHGFVEELVVSDDPEYKWIDKIRTPRASNEARQTLFFKLSGEVQRKIGLKALDLGGNAVIGYLQNFDLEGESGIVARGIGTAVTLVKSHDVLNFPNDNINIEEPSLAYYSQSKSHKQCTELEESNPQSPLSPIHIPDPTASKRATRSNDHSSHRMNLSKYPRQNTIIYEYPTDRAEEERSPQASGIRNSLKKAAKSYPSLSESIIQDASIRMMLALEDVRGETNKNKFDVHVKSLKKLFSTSDMEIKSDSNQRLNTSLKSDSSRSSLINICNPKKESVTTSNKGAEGIAALLIKSVHSIPLDHVKEDHETPITSTLTGDTEEIRDHSDVIPEDTTDAEITCSHKEEESVVKDHFVVRNRKFTKQAAIRDSSSSSEENTPSSENDFSGDFSNDSERYDILRDSNLSIDEELEVCTYSRRLLRAATFPPPKARLSCGALRRVDSDTQPLHEESTLCLLKCISIDQVPYNASFETKLEFDVTRTPCALNKEPETEDIPNEIIPPPTVPEVSTSKPRFNESDWSNILRNQQTDHSQDFSDPLATSTPVEALPSFFLDEQKPNTAINIFKDEGQYSSSGKVNDLPINDISERISNCEISEKAPQVHNNDIEKEISKQYVLEKTKKGDAGFSFDNLLLGNFASSAIICKTKNENTSNADGAERVDPAYSLLRSKSNIETHKVNAISEYTSCKDNLVYSSDKEMNKMFSKESLRKKKCLKNLSKRNHASIATSSMQSPTALPESACNKIAELNIKRNPDDKVTTEPTLETLSRASSIESPLPSSSSDMLDLMHKDRQNRMLDLIKTIDTKMLIHPVHHGNNGNGKVNKRKREKIYKSPNTVNVQKEFKHHFTKRHFQRCISADVMRVSSIPKDLSLNESRPNSPTPDSSSFKSSVESIVTHDTHIQSRLHKRSELSPSKRSFSTKRSAIDPRPHEITSKVLTSDTQISDSLRETSSNIKMKELKPRDTNILTSAILAGRAIHKSHSTCNVKGVSGHDKFTNNTNTANMTYNSCVSRPSPKHRQQDEASVSPSYPLPAVPPTVTKVCQSPATKAQPTASLHRRSSDSDLSVTPKGNSLGTSDRSVGGLLRTSTAVIRTMNQDALEMLEYPFITMQQYPPGFILHIGGLVSSRSVKLLERINNLEEPEGRDAWWKEIRMEVRSHARALACNVVIGYREETSICDDVCVLNAYGTAAVINFHNSSQETDGVFVNKMQSGSMTAPAELDREKCQHKPMLIKTENNEADTATPNVAHQTNKVRHISESKDHEVCNAQFQSKCNLCHLPYNETSVPFRVSVSKCGVCKRAKVPDVMFTTIELPEAMSTIGRGCIIQATVCKNKKDLRGELNAKEISDCLPFLEYELHSLLLNKLKVKGMNALFGLKLQVSVGERLIIGMAVGTAVFLMALPAPAIPQIASGNSWHKEEQLVEIRQSLVETVKKNREFYRLKPIADGENGRFVTSDTDESDEELPDVDFSVGTRDTCVLEVDDIEDMDRISLLMDDRPPDDFHVVNTQSIPGLEDLEIVRNLQMFTQISRAKIPAGQFLSMPSKYFARLLQSVYFKLRRMVPCALCDMQFKLALPEPDEIQFTVIGMALGLGDPVKNSKLKKKVVSHSVSKDQVKKADDSDMIFNLDVDHTDLSLDQPPSTVTVNTSSLTASAPKSRPRSPLRLKTHTTHRYKHVPLKGRYGVDITPLSYLPGGRIERYLGNLNFFFIRESTSIRENGGLSGFTHSFVTEVLAIVRAHITALGGNAMVAFFMSKCVLLHSPHKNQGQCLINVGGDVVSVSYFADEKHSGNSNC